MCRYHIFILISIICFVNIINGYLTVICLGIYSYPECKPDCLINNGGCPNGINCHQVNGRVYKVNSLCYEAISGCYGCLNNPSSYPDHLKLTDCAGILISTLTYDEIFFERRLVCQGIERKMMIVSSITVKKNLDI